MIQPESTTRHHPIEEETATLRTSTILIVDDIPVNVHILEAMLDREYEVHTALNGIEALSLAQKHTPDLILLDIMMPDMDGFELYRHLRLIESLRYVPIIFITARDDIHDESLGLQLGAADYITKPFNPDIVKLRVKNNLELKHHRDRLERISFTDALTGIHNRRRFDEYLEQEWKRAMRSGDQLSLLLIDIDLFKQFNDAYGHIAGDECLKSIARTISATLHRSTDQAFRYGGEEFACILPATDAAGARHVAEILRQGVEQLKIPHEYSTVSPWTTISVGITGKVPITDWPCLELVEKADTALYAAKQGGRNRVCSNSDAREMLRIGAQKDCGHLK